MPPAETIGADTVDVGLLSDLILVGSFMMFHDTNVHLVQEGRNHGSDMPLSDPVSLSFVKT